MNHKCLTVNDSITVFFIAVICTCRHKSYCLSAFISWGALEHKMMVVGSFLLLYYTVVDIFLEALFTYHDLE